MMSQEDYIFFLEKINFTEEEQKKFREIYPKLDILYQDASTNHNNSLAEKESLIKTGIWCTKEILGNSYIKSLEEKEYLFRELTKISRNPFDLQLNTNINKLFELLKFFKSILNKAANDPILSIPKKVSDELSTVTNVCRKMIDFYSIFFKDNTNTFFQYKKLIWAVFIVMRCKLRSRSNNLLECLELVTVSLLVVLHTIDCKCFPLKLKITEENKIAVINEELKLHYVKKIDENVYNKIKKELQTMLYDNQGCLLPVDTQIDILYKEYESYLKIGMFDERLLMCDLFKNITHASKQTSTIDLQFNLSCMKKLEYETPDPVQRTSYSVPKAVSATPINMTPFTRVVKLENWAHEFVQNLDPLYIPSLQNKYIPSYPYNPLLKNMKAFIGDLFMKFYNLIGQHKARIVTTMDDIISLSFKLIKVLFQKDNCLFTEEFTAMLLYSEDFIKAIVAVTCEIVLFIEDIEEVPFHKIPQELDIDMYLIWQLLNPLQISSISFPSEIKKHLEEVEYQLLTYLIWRSPSKKFINSVKVCFNQNIPEEMETHLEKVEAHEFIDQSLFLFHVPEDYNLVYDNNIIQSYDSHKSIRPHMEGYKVLNSMSIFFHRIINYCNLLNKKIMEQFSINEDICKESEDFIKKILTSEDYINVFYDKHIDQVILCVIYAILKNNGYINNQSYQCEIEYSFSARYEFKNIQDAYGRVKIYQSSISTNLLLTKVKIGEGKFITLQEYYNQFFYTNFQEILPHHFDYEEMGHKKRKLSTNEEEANKSVIISLRAKSAYGEKVKDYPSLQRKLNTQETRGWLYNVAIMEFKSKRLERVKDLPFEIIKSESTQTSFFNPLTNKLKIGLDSEKMIDFKSSQNSTPDFKGNKKI